MPAPLRLGLIGAGAWGRNYARTIAATPGAALAWTAGREWRGLLDRGGIDGVIVATPPQVHAEIALAAIDAGIPVLVEKPFTLDVAQAEAVRDLALARRVVTMVGHTQLFQPAYRALKRLLPEHGAVRAVRSQAGGPGPSRPDVPLLWDWGAHDVALCLDLLGASPARAVATSTAVTVELSLAFAGGVEANLRLSSNLPQKVRELEVVCERATLVFRDHVENQLSVAGRAVPVARELPLNVVVREFAAAISAAAFDPASVELGVGVVRVLAACARER